MIVAFLVAIKVAIIFIVFKQAAQQNLLSGLFYFNTRKKDHVLRNDTRVLPRFRECLLIENTQRKKIVRLFCQLSAVARPLVSFNAAVENAVMENNLSRRSTPTARMPRSNRLVFSLGSMLVITFVVAVVGLLLGRMFLALASGTPTAVGYFAILAALAPSLALVGAGTAFKLLRILQSHNRAVAKPRDS